MSEKRFNVMKKFDGSYVICDKGKMLVADDCCGLLNDFHSKCELLEDNCLADNWTRTNLEGIIKEQQATISALKDIFNDIITYSEWDSKKPYSSLRIAVDKKTYYKIREILNE